MNKIEVTALQRENAEDALYNMWQSVPTKNVVSKLERWRVESNPTEIALDPPTCNTLACFGGWCAWWPPFMSQGVKADWLGVPTAIIDTNNSIDMFTGFADDVSQKLFGVADMFGRAGDCQFDYPTLPNQKTPNDHELVRLRLERLIDSSVVE